MFLLGESLVNRKSYVRRKKQEKKREYSFSEQHPRDQETRHKVFLLIHHLLWLEYLSNHLQTLSQGLVLTLRFTFDPELDNTYDGTRNIDSCCQFAKRLIFIFHIFDVLVTT